MRRSDRSHWKGFGLFRADGCDSTLEEPQGNDEGTTKERFWIPGNMVLACDSRGNGTPEHCKSSKDMIQSGTNYWTSSLLICPFLDLAVACVILGMATFFLVSKITQFCNSLLSCCSGNGGNEQIQDPNSLEQHQCDLRENQRSCLTCDRTGRLNGICIGCIMRVLRPRTQESGGVILEEMIMDVASSHGDDGNLVAVSSSSPDRSMRRHVELLVEKLQLRITSEKQEAKQREFLRLDGKEEAGCDCLRQEGVGSKSCRSLNDPACQCSQQGSCPCWKTQGVCMCGAMQHPDATKLQGSTSCDCAASQEQPQFSRLTRQQESRSKQEMLAEALKMRELIENLYYELEQERNAAAVAADESMTMITRLQEERALLFMEARQYQRIVEEKAFHDHKAITILKEMLLKREAEKTVLEEEIEIYRRSSRNRGEQQDRQGETSATAEKKKSSSKEETSATIKAVEEERLSVLERVKRLEQQLKLLRDNNDNQPGYRKPPK